MLTKDLEQRLVAAFILKGCQRIDAQVVGDSYHPGTELSPLDDLFNLEADLQLKGREWAERTARLGIDGGEFNSILAEVLEGDIADLKGALKRKKPYCSPFDLEHLAEEIKKKLQLRLSEEEINRVGLRLINAQIQLNQAEIASLNGDWSPLHNLANQAKNTIKSYLKFAEVVKKYQDSYLAGKIEVRPGTRDDMLVECDLLLEAFANKTIDEVNTVEELTRFKNILRRYPKNRKQRFGNKALKYIIQNPGHEIINPKTANQYIGRLKAVIAFALKHRMVEGANVVEGERFQIVSIPEDDRSQYDDHEVKLLIQAICTKPLWKYGSPKPERFWIILIALFHGFRLGNIVSFTKRDICKLDNGFWVFMLRQGKTKNTIRPVAICDALLLLGFLEWVENLNREKLFQDTSDSFSKWYNRSEIRNGKPCKGFEASYVTTENKKCFYSLRHNFGGSIFEVTGDFKITADMLGHSTGKISTARYTKITKAKVLKEVTEKMKLDLIDLDALEARAKEMFF